jgi:hypothetical protein
MSTVYTDTSLSFFDPETVLFLALGFTQAHGGHLRNCSFISAKTPRVDSAPVMLLREVAIAAIDKAIARSFILLMVGDTMYALVYYAIGHVLSCNPVRRPVLPLLLEY